MYLISVGVLKDLAFLSLSITLLYESDDIMLGIIGIFLFDIFGVVSHIRSKRTKCKLYSRLITSTPIIRGINGTELVDLILKYYEELSEKYRKMIPLKMVYIPVPKEE